MKKNRRSQRIINALEVIRQCFSNFIENIRKAFNELFTILNGVFVKNEKVGKETIKYFVNKKHPNKFINKINKCNKGITIHRICIRGKIRVKMG
jgi:hypothetical protein